MRILTLSIVAASGVFLAMGQPQAAGCNGVVNIAEWGCAPWDNNNGPRYPHYKRPVTHPAPAARVQPHVQPYRPPQQGIVSNNGRGIVGNNRNGVVSQGGGNVVSQGGGNVVSHDGGTLISPGNRTGVVSQGGGNLITDNGGGLLSTNGGNFHH